MILYTIVQHAFGSLLLLLSKELRMGSEESIDKRMIEYQNHERMGIHKHIESEQQYYVEVVRELSNQTILKEWKTRVADIKQGQIGADIVYLPISHSYNKTEVCGSGGILTMMFEPWESFLKDEIKSRRKNQHNYTEEEVWFILFSLVKVGVLYQTKNKKIGDLQPKNVVITPQGYIKLLTIDSMPNQKTNFERIVEDMSSDVYLAPEQTDRYMIESGVYTIKSVVLADVFSLGVTILEVASLENCEFLYIHNPLRVSSQKLHYLLSKVRDKYSESLYQILSSCLDNFPSNRLSFIEIYDILKPFTDKIEQLLPFSLPGVDSSRQSSKGNKSPSTVPTSKQSITQIPGSSQEITTPSKKI